MCAVEKNGQYRTAVELCTISTSHKRITNIVTPVLYILTSVCHEPSSQ